MDTLGSAGLFLLVIGLALLILSFFDHRISALLHSKDSIGNTGATFTSIGIAVLALSVQLNYDKAKEASNANIKLSADLRNVERYMVHILNNSDAMVPIFSDLQEACNKKENIVTEKIEELLRDIKLINIIATTFRYDTNRLLNDNRDALINLGSDLNYFVNDYFNIASDAYSMLVEFDQQFTVARYIEKTADLNSKHMTFICNFAGSYFNYVNFFVRQARTLRVLSCALATIGQSGTISKDNQSIISSTFSNMRKDYYDNKGTLPKNIQEYVFEAASKVSLDGRRCSDQIDFVLYMLPSSQSPAAPNDDLPQKKLPPAP